MGVGGRKDLIRTNMQIIHTANSPNLLMILNEILRVLKRTSKTLALMEPMRTPLELK